MTADDWSPGLDAERQAAMEDPVAIEFRITGRNGMTIGIAYGVPNGMRGRIVSQQESYQPPPPANPMEMEHATRVDLPILDYALMVYGLECIPDGTDFPDTPGEPDA
jgi:hypothetical protein